MLVLETQKSLWINKLYDHKVPNFLFFFLLNYSNKSGAQHLIDQCELFLLSFL